MKVNLKPGKLFQTGGVAAVAVCLLAGYAAGQPGSEPELMSSRWSSFRSYSFPDHYIRHRNFMGEVTTLRSELDQLDSTFKVVTGLAGRVENLPTVSFESKNYPGYYLRHQHFRLKLHKNDGSDLFRKDASFKWRNLLLSTGEDFHAFEASNYRGYYIRQRADNPAEEAAKVFHLYLEKSPPTTVLAENENSAESRWRRDCTFKRVYRR